MRFLLVDTADARGCVALVSDSVLKAAEAHPGDEDFSSWLLPAVKRVLTSYSLSLADLDGYAVCSGPGSFTGLRVGLTTVKAWAEIYPKPIAAVSRLEAIGTYRESSFAGEPFPYTAAFLDARRNQVFAALYRSSSVAESESVIAIPAFVERVDSLCGAARVLWRSPDPQFLQQLPEWSARKRAGDLLEPVAPPFVVQLAALAHRKFLAGDITDAISLDANYVRRSDAELFWKDHASAVRA